MRQCGVRYTLSAKVHDSIVTFSALPERPAPLGCRPGREKGGKRGGATRAPLWYQFRSRIWNLRRILTLWTIAYRGRIRAMRPYLRRAIKVPLAPDRARSTAQRLHAVCPCSWHRTEGSHASRGRRRCRRGFVRGSFSPVSVRNSVSSCTQPASVALLRNMSLLQALVSLINADRTAIAGVCG